ncbi:putative epoxide hydrolase [Frankia canadensis]|uniref:Putative epoxide hydrolase n=1 Tax=Frankia canadensis TaxID=1836972 RepID=A0A2I2KU65_9ACTN|nr:epoxide hydrolase [Frankia canadensis]SNQ49202.1 putative epoxide hydrolase [Frankia canadensis]SOU56492.1 putative epoxide hydrolase [Frankia canadensis]
MSGPSVSPFELRVTDEQIADVRARLDRTRWPDQLPGVGWDYGTDLAALVELCRYWKDDFDWSRFQDRANAHPQLVTEIDGQRVHAIHARSPEPGARPLLLTHGWPGSVAEFWEVVGPLTDPARHGGDPADAFHVVVPSLPGYGFSGPTTATGWDVPRVAAAFLRLMTILGYDRFFAQGGDWGSRVSVTLAGLTPERVAALHLNLLPVSAPDRANPTAGLDADDLALVAANKQLNRHETAYQRIQSTKPQTLAYGLADSPAGLAGWILEKFHGWSHLDAKGEIQISQDRLLDNISIYWLTGTINSSTRLYYESVGPGRFAPLPPLAVPLGHTVFPGEPFRPPRAWAEAAYPTLCHWSQAARGGHFAALEEPGLFTDEVRTFFRTQRIRPA